MRRLVLVGMVAWVASAQAFPKGGVIRAPRVNDNVLVVDGKLSEWQAHLFTNAQKIVLTKDTGFINVGSFDNDKDFRAVVYVLYDSKNLYVGASVVDDAIEKGFTGGNNWQNDCIEIWIDGANDGGTMTDFGGADADNYQLNVDVKGEPFVYRNDAAAAILKEIKSAATLEGTDYSVEVRIPFSVIPEVKVKPEGSIGFSVSFVDSDRGSWNHLLWQGDTENNPEQWGDLIFATETLSVGARGKLPVMWGSLRRFEKGVPLSQPLTR